ncbi:hypothetical protein [Streptosporangium sp. NPDC049046]|uniref:hypothetical protein n=1 Tax=Streptosporangium sp. NPDC049046 TaxID=3155031 RepID=UPI0034208C20
MRVEDLSDAERRVWEAFPHGEEVDFTTGKPDEDNPAVGAVWGTERTIRARVIATLLMSEEVPQSHRIPALRIKGARITERMNLAYSTICHSARFLSCFFEQEPGLYWARCQQMSFKGSHLPGLSASNVHMDGHLRLDGCVATGLLELRGAQLAGSLTMNRARISAPDMAIDCDRLQTGRGLSAKGLQATGQVRLSSARVIGAMILDGARLTDARGLPLDMDGLVADGSVLCRGMAVAGMVSLRNARVTGPFSFTGTTIDYPGKMAFRGSRITAEGGLYLSDGFTATGTVRLADSRIDRELSLKDAHLAYSGGRALQAAELQVEGSIDARGLIAEGRVNLTQARIAGSLNLAGASLSVTNPDASTKTALDADGVNIGGRLSCTEGFRADGALRLADARIGTFADFNGARLSNSDGRALDLSRTSVGGGLECGRGFTAEGELTLVGARLGRHLDLTDATLSAPGAQALVARQLEARELYLRPKQTLEGVVDLRHARIGVIYDDPATWSPRHQNGLVYDALEPMLSVTQRLTWLKDDLDGYVPQPYEQLATTYRRLGHDVDARTVLLVKQQRQRRQHPRFPWHARAWGWLQDVTVGYGYRPIRAALWFLILLIAGAVVFTLNNPPRAEPGKGPAFNAFVYVLDLLFPLIDFGQEKAYQPTGGGQWVAYGLVIAGWVLATTIATGITRALSRQ